MKVSGFVFDCTSKLHYKSHKITLKMTKKEKKTTLKPETLKNYKYFKYALLVTLLH